MKSKNQQLLLSQAGFTLVEIMVGLVIGMLASIVILQVFSTFEEQKRTTTGTADAQTNGGIALYNITRELKLAGYPLMPVPNPADPTKQLSPLTCPSTADFDSSTISPVIIADGGAGGGSDSITIQYGNTPRGGIPTPIDKNTNPIPNPSEAKLKSTLGCSNLPAGNVILVINSAGNCFMASAGSASEVDNFITLLGVPPAGYLDEGNNLACLGNWNTITYSVINDASNEGFLARNGELRVVGVVNLQAQYGIATAGLLSTNPNFNQVTSWVDAAGGWAAPTVANRNLIKAVRIAVVARNAKREPNSVTASPLTTWNGGPTITLTAEDQHYRYRVFETIIPLRNMLWAKDAL